MGGKGADGDSNKTLHEVNRQAKVAKEGDMILETLPSPGELYNTPTLSPLLRTRLGLLIQQNNPFQKVLLILL